MKGIIVYKGKYGATAQYAAWLASELNLPVKVSDECQGEELADSDFVLIGTSVYIGILTIKAWIKINAKHLAGKKIYFFIVCGTPVKEKEKLQSYLKPSIPAELLKDAKVYFLPGRVTYKKLSLIDKFMLRMGYLLSSKKEREKSNFADFDAVKKENLTELIQDVKQQLGKEQKSVAAH